MHEYLNGIRMPDDCVLRRELEIAYHEPVEELIFYQAIREIKYYQFVDIGCSFGYYLILAKKILNSCTIIGYEMQEKRRKRIESNLYDNGFVVSSDDYIGSECGCNDINKWDKGGLLMMDVQGAEIRLLSGASLDNYEQLIIGTHKPGRGVSIHTHSEVLRILKQKGYKIIWECEPGMVNFQPDGVVWVKR